MTTPFISRVLGVAAAEALLLPSLASAQPVDPLPPVAIDPAIAAAIAKISPDRLRSFDTKLVAFGTRSTFSEALGPKRGIFAARDFIAAQFREISKSSGGRLTVAYDEHLQPADANRIPRDVLISSVVATLKGDDPSGPTYVMSSHMDSRNSSNEDAIKDAPGADDNGSGSAAVLEAARVLAPLHFRGTILFCTFDSEEQGLLGAEHLARTLAASKITLDADINNDIIGASVGHDGVKRGDIVRLYSEALPPDAALKDVNIYGLENDSPSRQVARYSKEIGEAYVPSMHVDMQYRADRYGRGGDHEAFNAQGFAGVRFTEAAENFDHQHQDVRVENGIQFGDLLEFMDFDYLARVTQINASIMASLASAPAKPKRLTTTNPPYVYDTMLKWLASSGAASYEVVWRRSSESQWTHARNVGNVTSYTATNLTKDNDQFGVRALDAQGHRSVVSFPTLVR